MVRMSWVTAWRRANPAGATAPTGTLPGLGTPKSRAGLLEGDTQLPFALNTWLTPCLSRSCQSKAWPNTLHNGVFMSLSSVQVVQLLPSPQSGAVWSEAANASTREQGA